MLPCCALHPNSVGSTGGRPDESLMSSSTMTDARGCSCEHSVDETVQGREQTVGPSRLTDLPLDILNTIIGEVSRHGHTWVRVV